MPPIPSNYCRTLREKKLSIDDVSHDPTWIGSENNRFAESRDKLSRIARQNAARRQQDPDTELNGGVGGLGSSISRTRALEGVRCRGRGVRARGISILISLRLRRADKAS